MDNNFVWHVFWNNIPLMSFMGLITSIFYNMFRNFRIDIKQEIATFKAESDKKFEANERKWESNERKWEAMTARIDNSYTLILEEIRSRKQGGN